MATTYDVLEIRILIGADRSTVYMRCGLPGSRVNGDYGIWRRTYVPEGRPALFWLLEVDGPPWEQWDAEMPPADNSLPANEA